MQSLREVRAWIWISLLFSIGASLGLGLDFHQAQLILTEIRLPRLILGLAVGAVLAVSGVLMQTLFSNPIADSYSLGVGSGASLGAVIFAPWVPLSVGAIFGALGVGFGVLNQVHKKSGQSAHLLLTGTLLNVFLASVLTVWLSVADAQSVQEIIFWLLGDLGRVNLKLASVFLVATFLGIGTLLQFSSRFDTFLFGEDWVGAFGVSRKKIQFVLVLWTCIFVGVAVSFAGLIGFVGLVIPHGVRKIRKSPLHRGLILDSAILGATLLVGCDAMGRYLAFPREVPVGAITALFGAPLVYQLFRQQRGGI